MEEEKNVTTKSLDTQGCASGQGKRHRPQDDVPVEVITHYIVKDYQRMYKLCEKMQDYMYAQRAEIARLKLLLTRGGGIDGQARTEINNLNVKVNSLSAKYAKERDQRMKAVNKYNKIRSRLLKFQNILNQLPAELEEIEEMEEEDI